MFKYFLKPVYLTQQTYLAIKTSDLSVLSFCVCALFMIEFLLSVWACLLVCKRERERETVEERRGCSLQTPVAVDHYVCVQVSLRVAVGGDNPGDRQRRWSVCGGGLLSGTDQITACNIFNSRLSRSVAAFRDLTLSHCRPERQQTDFIYCN